MLRKVLFGWSSGSWLFQSSSIDQFGPWWFR